MRYIIKKDVTIKYWDDTRLRRLVLVHHKEAPLVAFGDWWHRRNTRLKLEEVIDLAENKKIMDVVNIDYESIRIKLWAYRVVWFFWRKYDEELTFQIQHKSFIRNFNEVIDL